jgi:hypothetical protein
MASGITRRGKMVTRLVGVAVTAQHREDAGAVTSTLIQTWMSIGLIPEKLLKYEMLIALLASC